MSRSTQVTTSVEAYLDRSPRPGESGTGRSVGTLLRRLSGAAVADHWLDTVHGRAVAEAHRVGDLHLHDLDTLGGSRAGWSLSRLLTEGLDGVPGVAATPARHLSSALGQVSTFLAAMQDEWAGAQSFGSVDTLLAPYVHVDGLDDDAVRQEVQGLVHRLNAASRWGTRPPFSTFAFDLTCPPHLARRHPVVGGRVLDVTYGDLAAEAAQVNRAFVDVLSVGDAEGRVLPFPVPVYTVTPDLDWDSPFADALFAMTARYGTPYFRNGVGPDRADAPAPPAPGGGLLAGAELGGSIGSVTLNTARLGYLHAGAWDALLAAVDHLVDLAVEALEDRRRTVQRLLDDGLLPWTRRHLATLDAHVGTVGVNGINEMVRNFSLDLEDITTPTGHRTALDLLDHLTGRLAAAQERTGRTYVLEASPAEEAATRFAQEDRARFPDILQAGTADQPFYTNSSQLPVGFTDDPFEALQRQEDLQTRYTGGTVLHLYMAERLSDAQACKTLVRRALESFRLPLLTVTPTFSVCPAHGYLAGEQPQCPTCGGATEVWTRVMGYFRPVASFTIGKKGEHAARVPFKEVYIGA